MQESPKPQTRMQRARVLAYLESGATEADRRCVTDAEILASVAASLRQMHPELSQASAMRIAAAEMSEEVEE